MNSSFEKPSIDEALLASVVCFSEDSIIVTTTELDPPGPQIIYVNPAFTRMTGYEPDEVLGKTPRILQGPNTDINVLRRLRAALEKGEVFFGQAINYRKDGTEFWNEWHIEALRGDQDEITHYIAIQRNVTKRKEMEDALVRKNAALTEILSQIEIEKQKIKDNVRANVEEVLMPAIKKLGRKGSSLDKTYLKVLEKNLMDLTGSFGRNVSQDKLKLSPREIEIANMIKNGLSNKEIAEAVHISVKTVETHRNKIRKKLGIVNKDINLTSYMQSV
ncbi:MAG: PAS domain-containing protein [Candidatus Omnitrophica bacterium]|nr:PAS domain-containing protein [Candidatus Omnitrophota bacterium]